MAAITFCSFKSRIFGDDVLTIPQDSDPVSDREYLIQLVRDINDCHPVGLQGAHNFQQALHFPLAEGGGGLVHHNDLGFKGQGSRNFNQLLLGHGKFRDDGARVDLDAQAIHHFLGTLYMAFQSMRRPRVGSRLIKTFSATLR